MRRRPLARRRSHTCQRPSATCSSRSSAAASIVHSSGLFPDSSSSSSASRQASRAESSSPNPGTRSRSELRAGGQQQELPPKRSPSENGAEHTASHTPGEQEKAQRRPPKLKLSQFPDARLGRPPHAVVVNLHGEGKPPQPEDDEEREQSADDRDARDEQRGSQQPSLVMPGHGVRDLDGRAVSHVRQSTSARMLLPQRPEPLSPPLPTYYCLRT